MNELFNDLPDVLDAKALARALSISKSGAYIKVINLFGYAIRIMWRISRKERTVSIISCRNAS